ncbi:MAG: DUF1559 domain-containing protein [Candidatus Saccharimonas sp.]|nr:DUF1559 domain-containing protein [Planctomycetaceae bacterium]
MVVLAVIGILLAIGLPAVQQMRQSARNAECKNKLKQIAVALQNHQSQFGYLPKDGDKGWGYTVYLLSQVEQASLFQRIDPDQNPLPVGGAVQPGVTDVVVPVYLCPSFTKDPNLGSGFGRLNYLGNAELLNKKKMQLSDVTDGESMTISVGETTSDRTWAQPGTATGSPPNQGGSFGSQHGMGANFVMCDGTVRWIQDSVDGNVIRALFTIAAKDVVGEF